MHLRYASFLTMLTLSACGDDASTTTTPDTTTPDVATEVEDDTTSTCDTPRTCTPGLTGGSGDPIVYTSASCWVVRIDDHQVIATDPTTRNKYEAWGASDPATVAGGTAHENINGKHVKDFLGTRRTVLFDDVVLTFTTAATGGVDHVSLYDATHGWQIDNLTNTVISTTTDATATATAEAAQADGETGRLMNNPGCVMRFDNVWQQDADGGAKVEETTPIGETGGVENPTQVRDYYDDPRLGHT